MCKSGGESRDTSGGMSRVHRSINVQSPQDFKRPEESREYTSGGIEAIVAASGSERASHRIAGGKSSSTPPEA
jgi:hypothetical protein